MFMYNGVWDFVLCHNVYLAIGICCVFSLTAKHKQRESIKKVLAKLLIAHAKQTAVVRETYGTTYVYRECLFH